MRPTRTRWVIFALACAISWLLYLHRYAWAVISPYVIKENPQWTAEEIGWLDSAFMLTYALGQVPGGRAGDILGPRSVLSVMIVAWSLCLAGFAWVGGFWPFAGMRG